MKEQGNLQLYDLERKNESLNKTGGINTAKSVFNTKKDSDDNDSNSFSGGMSPYMNRVEELANRGPLMQSRIHTTNDNDIAMKKRVTGAPPKEAVSEKTSGKVRAEEETSVIKAQPDLKVFSGDVMKKGTFTPQAKEAARHFFKQLSDWAGSFNGHGSKVYGELGISTVLDCLYVDGMSLRNYVKEQYFYKATGDPVHDKEMLRNYVALIAARGQHVITLVRPHVKGNEAEVEFKNLNLDLTNVGEEEASRSRKLKEKGDQVRRNLKKRMEKDMTAETGKALRKTMGCEMDGFKRIEGAETSLKDANGSDTPEYASFDKCFSRYYSGLQKLGLKPGRDDINAPVAKELLRRCSEALDAAELFLKTGSKDKKTVDAVEKAKKELETDMELLNKAINDKLSDEFAKMPLSDLLDSSKDDAGKGDGKTPEDSSTNDDNNEPPEE